MHLLDFEIGNRAGPPDRTRPKLGLTDGSGPHCQGTV